MKILIASVAATGHLNPLLAIGTMLKNHGHEVAVQTNEELRPLVEAADHRFISEVPNAQTSVSNYFERFGSELEQKTPGIEHTSFLLINFFAPAMPSQFASLQMALHDFPADLILADSLYWGTIPMLVGPRHKRPAIAHLGVSTVNVGSGKNVPTRDDETPEERAASHLLREQVMLQPAQQAVNEALRQLGCPELPCPILEAMATLPDLYLHPGIKSFEYPDPDSASKVRFIGALPVPSGQASLPDWWQHLDRTKKLVLVTQGTLANRDLGQLVAPALIALADREDFIILVTTGGPAVEAIPTAIPANTRVVSFLPYAQILPEIDLLITNGGYGTVNMAIAHGVPIVSAGLTEDKDEVNAHVQWSGAGIDLITNQPTPDAIKAAVDTLLTQPQYRERAQQLAREFATHNAEAELLNLIEACISEPIGA
jgi:MGT family glycosyltransferase